MVKQRQSAMTLQGKYFGPLARHGPGQGAVQRGRGRAQRRLLDALSRMPWDGFDASTKDVKSAALPAVFTDTAKFKEAQERFQGAVAKLVAVSKGSDEAAAKAAIGAVGKACGGCHDNFRQKP